MKVKSKLTIDEYYSYKYYLQELSERNLLLNISSPLISFDDSLRQIYLNSFTGCEYDHIVYVPDGVTCIDIKKYDGQPLGWQKGYKSIVLPDTVQFILDLNSRFNYFDTCKVEYLGRFPDIINSYILVIRDSLDFSNIMAPLAYKKLIIAKTAPYSLRKCKCIKNNIPDESQIYVDSNCIKYGSCKSNYIICSQYDTFERSIPVSHFTCVNATFVKESINDIICSAKIEKKVV